MKTVLIYDQCGEAPVSFLVLEGDYTHYDKVFINSTESDEKLQDKLSRLMYDKDGQLRHKMRSKFPHAAVRAGAKVIVCGFIP